MLKSKVLKSTEFLHLRKTAFHWKLIKNCLSLETDQKLLSEKNKLKLSGELPLHV